MINAHIHSDTDGFYAVLTQEGDEVDSCGPFDDRADAVDAGHRAIRQSWNQEHPSVYNTAVRALHGEVA